MQVLLLSLFILQNFTIVQLNDHEKHFVNLIKRDVYSSSLQNLNFYTKTYENGQNIIFDAPNFQFIDSLLSIVSIDHQLKSSVSDHMSWSIRQISSNKNNSNQYTEIVRYDIIQKRFVHSYQKNYSFTINENTGQLTLINTNDNHLLHTEITLHAESGLSQGDDIIHDIYRLIRLSTETLNCTTNVTLNDDESIEITCTIEYEFLNYDDIDSYQPTMNFTLYIKDHNSMLKIIDQNDLKEIRDLKVAHNMTSRWKRSIVYVIIPKSKKETNQDIGCIIIPDTLRHADLFQDNKRICRINITIKNDTLPTISFPILNQWDIMDVLIFILIVFSSLLFIISLVLCLATKQYNKKRIVQIKPENKTITLPLNHQQTYSNEQLFSNNNEIKSEIPLITSQEFSVNSIRTFSSEHIHRHKPGCPKYMPSPEHNLLSSNLFTHTTIDNIKKIILPDIPDNHELFDDQTYIHFYIPSKSENISLKNIQSNSIEKDKSSD